MNFKERKETKLEELREKQLKEEEDMMNIVGAQRQRSVEIMKRGAFSHRSIPTLIRKKSEAEADAFYRKLSTENLKKIRDSGATAAMQNDNNACDRSPCKRSN